MCLIIVCLIKLVWVIWFAFSCVGGFTCMTLILLICVFNSVDDFMFACMLRIWLVDF